MAKCLKAFLLLLTRDRENLAEILNIINTIKINKNINLKIREYYEILIHWSKNELYNVNQKLIKLLERDPKDILAFRLFH